MNLLPDQNDPVGAATLSIISEADQFNRWMYDEIKPLLTGLVLELGSGIGNISRLALEDGFSIVLSDINPAYTEVLQSTFSVYPNLLRVVSIDLQHPQFEQQYEEMRETFDTVFLLNVIEHLKDDQVAVRNCRYLLKPGGRLILLAPAYRFLFCQLDKNLGHHRRYTTHTLSALLTNNGMKLLQKKYFNFAGIGGWLVWGKLLGKPQLQAGTFNIFNKMVPFFQLADKMVFHSIGLSVIAAGTKI